MFILGFILVFFSALYRQQRTLRRLADRQASEYVLTLSEDGLDIAYDGASGSLEWRKVAGIQRKGERLFIHLDTLQVIVVPLDRLPAPWTASALLAEVSALSGFAVKTHAPANAPEPAGSSHVRDWLRNLKAGATFFVSPTRADGHLTGSALQLILLFATSLTLNLIETRLRAGEGSTFNLAGVPHMLYFIPLILATAWLTARLAGDDRRALVGAVAMMSVLVAGRAIFSILGLIPANWWEMAGETGALLYWAFYVWMILASVVALIRSQSLDAGHRAAAFLAMMLVLVIPSWWLQQVNEDIWQPPFDNSAYAAWEARQARMTNEAVLYAQPELLSSALNAIRPGREGIPELFSISMGGHGSQDVFLREVVAVDQLMTTRFDTAGHNLLLVNNTNTMLTHPVASMTALRKALVIMGERMNLDEDVLMLFMTSHGASDFTFDLQLGPYQFDALTPETLKAALDEAKIRYRVIVVSACYSGGFVSRLADENTMVMSASRHDRNSHGCSHENEWTFFGRAMFDEALRESYSFESAFTAAKAAVDERERKESLKPSLPQIAVGENIRAALAAIEARLAQTEAADSPGSTRLSTDR
ncbi:C13 family peptidase [Nitrogeniibacter aestuarii]|uniref:C13 family peptidase n=1 Tax=Nitrogeniibacter aestuarii TaxID=2815343 RepID=UPI001E48E41B|nr:C13 family peptidase [Nitrogeniibacter aestuarii]